MRDVHDWSPLEDIEREIRVDLIQRFRSWRQASGGKYSVLISGECKTYTIGVLLSRGAA